MNNLRTVEIEGFIFIEVGTFYNDNEPLIITYKGKPYNLTVSLRLFDAKIKQVEESAYLIYVDDELVYVGEYSYNLADRWLRKENYINHHKGDDIYEALERGSEVTLWLSTNPYARTENNTKINISKSIEQEILRHRDLDWNKQGKLKQHESWIEDNCKKITAVLPKSELVSTVHIPDNTSQDTALSRTTHLAIGAHQDDLEIMAYHGIVACLGDEDNWFTGVTCTNGAGSARTGPFAHYSNDEMMAIRVEEQNQAADLGRFSAMLQLGYPSSVVKDPTSTALQDELTRILMATKPEIVYTHNPADKHPTHIGIVIPTLLAIRTMPMADRPKKVIGCEVWRDLDWMPDEDKVAMDVSDRENMATALVALFDSQIAGGKRYDLATIGRRRANATYYSSHAVDEAEQIAFGMDLTPLIKDDSLDIVEYVHSFIQKFSDDVMGSLNRQLGR